MNLQLLVVHKYYACTVHMLSFSQVQFLSPGLQKVIVRTIALGMAHQQIMMTFKLKEVCENLLKWTWVDGGSAGSDGVRF